MKTKLNAFISILCLVVIFSACQKELTFDNLNTGGNSTGTAKFTYAVTAGNCTNPVINGTFQAGTPLDISNNIIVQVNVTDTGNFTITSTTANGIKFITSGLFISTGSQPVIFIGTGTPAAGGSFNFTLGNEGCSFSITCSATTPVNNNNCKACGYVPLCVGSKYSYYDTTSGNASIRNSDLLSTADTTIDAKIYQKITSSNGPGYYNCTNGETTAIGYQLVSNNGNTLQKIKITMLKANAPVGTTWSDTVINSSGQTVIQNLRIVNKGISKALGGFNFADVIEVNLETGIDIPGSGYFPLTTSTYFYAKGIGLVEMISGNYAGSKFYHSVIKSYFIP